MKKRKPLGLVFVAIIVSVAAVAAMVSWWQSRPQGSLCEGVDINGVIVLELAEFDPPAGLRVGKAQRDVRLHRLGKGGLCERLLFKRKL